MMTMGTMRTMVIGDDDNGIELNIGRSESGDVSGTLLEDSSQSIYDLDHHHDAADDDGDHHHGASNHDDIQLFQKVNFQKCDVILLVSFQNVNLLLLASPDALELLLVTHSLSK